ncbi:MAG: glycosyltransferase [Bacilli bacterium]|nr:glycosyltransferase [Bacilli bacterium]
MKKKDILFVVDERRMGGVSVLLEDILNMINLNKFNIDILVLHNNGEKLTDLPKEVNLIYGTKYFSSIDYTLKEVIKSFNLSKIYHKFKVILDMKTGNIKNTIRRERKKILTKKYDLEIAFKDGFTALFTIFGDSTRKIHWLHYEYKKVNPNGKYDKLFKKILPEFDEIIAVSDGVKNAFNEIYHLEDKTKVIANVVDTIKIKEKAKEKSDVILNKKDINFVSVGRIHEQKGYDKLIKAINQLKEEKILPKNFKLRLYGDGPQKEYLHELITKYNLEDKVSLMGKVTNPYKYLKDSDMFMLPSRYEAFGLVIIEAMTLGIPVLATENHATNKIIKDKINGYITENSYNGIYLGLKYILNNLDELEKYKQNLLNYEYDNETIIKELEGVLSNEK